MERCAALRYLSLLRLTTGSLALNAASLPDLHLSGRNPIVPRAKGYLVSFTVSLSTGAMFDGLRSWAGIQTVAALLPEQAQP